MKVQNDAIRALLAQDEAHRKTQTGIAGPGGAGGFDALLSGQMQPAGAGGAAANTLPGQGITAPAEQSATALALLMRSSDLLDRTRNATGQEEAADLEAQAASRIDGLLGQWESYAAALDGGADLRSVYGLLQDMTNGVKDLKASLPGFLESDSALGALVNELDVLSTTENIKFNRGDYL
ncbi:MAG: hypothetical protein LBM64_00975 [Deltaproteobacteria bacterium]|jgi:hypothetical protein|nr:hypothetical protein [Deltaproteobacteria bacterium]